MARLLVCALLLFAPGLAHSQEAPKETLRKFVVHPAAAPRPVLKVLLLPDLREMQPGNPIHGYLKAFMEQQNFFHHKDSVANREKWLVMPLKDLPVKELRGYGGSGLRQADYAARLDTPDWQTLVAIRRDGINLLLPEVQQLRMLAAALKVRMRGEVADRRFDDGLRSAKTMFALARHLGEHPTLITNLVGLAVAMIAIDPLEEMVVQPGSPNLYWALTNLPEPLVSLRRGLQGERMFLDVDLPALDPREAMTEKELARAIDKIRALFRAANFPEKEVAPWLKAKVGNEGFVRAARKRLVEAGLLAKAVEGFPAAQVVLLDDRHQAEVVRDEGMKWAMLPWWQLPPGALTTRPQEDGLLSRFWGEFTNVRRAQVRVEQRLAMLRVVEALRLHAARTKALPAKLADVREPLPIDPFTGRLFLYEVKDGVATLRGTPPRGMETTASYNLRYEITLARP